MQLELIEKKVNQRKFPQTRYQGSKRKISDWIVDNLDSYEYETVLDAFGGSGAVAYEFKRRGKTTYYNDYLRFNYYIGKALIENKSVQVLPDNIKEIKQRSASYCYNDLIQRIFKDIYFYDKENVWLDIVSQNILMEPNEYKKAIMFTALFQSCIIKRPFNLFHRNNLYIRDADVKRSFGNKTTWDKGFDFYFEKFTRETNEAIFDNGKKNLSFCNDVIELMTDVDLVYFDPPYTNNKGISVDYHNFYHFLEGLTQYHEWENYLEKESKNLRLKKKYNPWNSTDRIKSSFGKLFEKFKDSIIVVSYRNDGIPSVEELIEFIKIYGNKKKVEVRVFENYKYVFSQSQTNEILLIGT